MTRDEYQLQLDKEKYRTRKESTINIVLVVALLIESFIIMALYGSQRTVVLPPKISEPFWVHDNEVDSSYLSDFAEFVASKAVNLTPNNASRQLSSLLPYVASEAHDGMREEFERLVTFIIENDLTQTFHPGNVDSSSPGKLLIDGTRQRAVGGKTIESKRITLEIHYHIRGGRFELVNLGSQK